MPPAAKAIAWDKAPDRTNDLPALQNGAKLFVNYCLNCHSAAFMRYNRLQDIGLTEAADQGQPAVHRPTRSATPMKAAIDPKQAKEWFGADAARPDLIAALALRPRRHRRRLPVHLPAHLLPRRHQGHRLEQPGLPERRHAARAVGTAGRARAACSTRSRRTATTSRCSRAGSRSRPGTHDAAAVRPGRRRPGRLPAVDGRAGAEHTACASASGCCCSWACSP